MVAILALPTLVTVGAVSDAVEHDSCVIPTPLSPCTDLEIKRIVVFWDSLSDDGKSSPYAAWAQTKHFHEVNRLSPRNVWILNRLICWICSPSPTCPTTKVVTATVESGPNLLLV
ncbi:hypothetical protein BC830DRAFT_139761 [Chytriomyces sp. MP71]|nr:hypothetical protein BC830DRAFT_139761 [Chytriomyces sp. MP71]